MNDMQWALLFIGVAVVIGVYFHARRQAAKQAVWNNKRKREGMEEDQLDFFKDDGAGFDEFGVGKARPAGKAPKPEAAPAPREKKAKGKKAEASPNPPQELFVISVHRNDMSFVPGAELHRALQSCGLEFGDHEIYHRHSPQGDPVFSVASLVKPGFLNPADKDSLQTPGVSLFLQLPGAVDGAMAFDDFLTTAQSLAERINGSLLDRQRQALTVEAIEDMRRRCEAFSAQN